MAIYTRPNTNKKKLFSPRSFLIVGVLLAGLTWYLYQGYSTGTGLFAALGSPASINKVVIEDENTAKNAAERKAIQNLNNAANAEARAKTPEQKKQAEAALNAASYQYAQAQAATIAKEKRDKEKPKTAPIIPGDNGGVTTTVAGKKICNVREGVNVEAGKWVPTGFGLDSNLKRCTTSGCPLRECIQITQNCEHGKVAKPCSIQYKSDPSSVILPASAGPEYTIGETTAEVQKKIKEAITNNQPIPTDHVAQKQCHLKDKSGVWIIVPTGALQDKDKTRCFNGDWKSETDFDTNMKDTCGGRPYDPVANQCLDSAAPQATAPQSATPGIPSRPSSVTAPAKQPACKTGMTKLSGRDVYVTCSPSGPPGYHFNVSNVGKSCDNTLGNPTSCSQVCDTGVDGRTKSIFSNGQWVCDVPLFVSAAKPPVTTSPDTSSDANFSDAGATVELSSALPPTPANQNTTSFAPVAKDAGKGALVGAGVGTIFCVGGGLLTGGIGIPLILPCLSTIGSVSTLLGGVIGFGVGVSNTTPIPSPSTSPFSYDPKDLESVIRDAKPGSLPGSTLTDDPGNCQDGGQEISGYYGGSIVIGYKVFRCR